MNRELAMTFISRAIDGELPERQRARLEAWLDAHPEDRELTAQWQALGRLTREEQAALPVPDAERMWQDVRRAIRNAEAQPAEPSFAFFRWRLAWGAAMVALLFATAAGWGLWRGQQARVALAAAEAGRPARIEWSDTEVPGASTMVYEDEDAGVAVVWLLTDDKPAKKNDAG